MRVLFVGNIVGPGAVDWLAGRLPGMRRDLGLDLVIANAENCTVHGSTPYGGFGMRADLVATLFANGVDVVTSGNHAWDSPDAAAVLTQPRVLRPHNLPPRPDRPGLGVVTITTGGETVTVVNLADAGAIPDALPPYAAWREIAATLGDAGGTVIVDFHGESAFAKHGFAHAVAGEVAAVLGTHTHEPTTPLHLL
ncbi:MAG: YmdB family metallophosphoesterase, partial [Chloroflexota bacterium]|nr:YmdB family metallophosphoesterase [Chloroflexota bacterium]